MTDDLIARLSEDVRPVSPHALRWRLILAATVGIVASTIIMFFMLGPQTDLDRAFGSANLPLKFGYTLSIGLLAAWAISRVARPGEQGSSPLALMPVVVAVLAAAAVVTYVNAPEEERRNLVMGSSALVCPFYILTLSVPLLAAFIVFLRRMAPTELTRAGLAAGLGAGAFGALVYGFHCPEPGVPFVALWYSLGILAAGLAGAIAGRYVLRW